MTDIKWNPPTQLPTPNIPLLLKLTNNYTLKGIRPNYIASRNEGDLGYRLQSDITVKVDGVVGWSYQ